MDKTMTESPEMEKRRNPGDKKNLRGYTMVEIMLAVGLIGIIASMAIPNMQRARQNALETCAIEGLKQISEAEEMYYDVYGYYAPGHGWFNQLRRVDAIDHKAWGKYGGRRGWFIKGYSLEGLNLGSFPQNYSIVAWPLERGMPLRTFFIVGDGIIRDTEYNEPINIY